MGRGWVGARGGIGSWIFWFCDGSGGWEREGEVEVVGFVLLVVEMKG